MAKLYFRYGTVGSAKTMNLLAVAHNYRQQNKKVLLIKPKLDTRFGAEQIRSRSGLEKNADILIDHNTNLFDLPFKDCQCLLVDEAQFLNEPHIEQLRVIATHLKIPVICYGLRTDFKRQLFRGAKRLLELADSIEEIKNTCHYCNRKSIFNLKLINGLAATDGPQIELGAEELYLPTCSECYDKEIEKSIRSRQKPATEETSL